MTGEANRSALTLHEEAVSALRDPILLIGVGSVGNMTAAAAVQYIVDALHPRQIGQMDPDEFYDFTVARPRVTLTDGERTLDWPTVRLFHLPTPEHDLVLMVGLEPHLRWAAFVRQVAELAQVLDIRQVILLSAFAGGTPHTRPVPVQWYPLSGDGAPRFGRLPTKPSYQGAATFGMALSVMLRDAGLQVGVLNAIAPFYVGVEPSPHAVRGLVETLGDEFGLVLDVADLDRAIEEVARLVAQQAATNESLAGLVAQLEQQYDTLSVAREAPALDELLTLDASAVLSDVEALLREHHDRRGDASSSGRAR